MDQIFVTKYSQDNISHDKTNTIEFICVFFGYIFTSIGFVLILKKCFECCVKEKKTNNLEYVSLNSINHHTYQSSSLV
jgi:hypothetical protein